MPPTATSDGGIATWNHEGRGADDRGVNGIRGEVRMLPSDGAEEPWRAAVLECPGGHGTFASTRDGAAATGATLGHPAAFSVDTAFLRGISPVIDKIRFKGEERGAH